MDTSAVDLNLLVAFDALLTERHVTRAAKRLGMGQPAMSAALARLRAALGDELFVRTADGMQPTPKALRIAPSVSRALAELKRVLDAEVPFDAAATRRNFTIASTDYTTMVLMPAFVRDVRQAAPSIDLRIVGYDKQAIDGLIDRGEVDLALGVFPKPTNRHVCSRLFKERFVGVVRQGHPAFVKGVPKAKTLANLPHVLVTVRRDDRGALDTAFEAQGMKRRVAVTLPHMLALPAILATSDLVAAVPERGAKAFGGSGLSIFELPIATQAWEVMMLWSPHARSDRASAWLRSKLQKSAKGL